MYWCFSCSNYFEYPKLVHEAIGECCGQVAYEDYDACPNCGSMDVSSECKECPICGEPVFEGEYCEDCMTWIRTEIANVVARILCHGALPGDAEEAVAYVINEDTKALMREAEELDRRNYGKNENL